MPDNSDTPPTLTIICGPTAVGKTELTLALAERFDGEIISADSRQVYRLMDIGTAKPTKADQQQVRHHLIDVVWPNEDIQCGTFYSLAEAAMQSIRQRNKRPFLAGGTGLYIRALTEGLLDAPGADPELRKRLHDRAEQEGNSARCMTELAKVDPAISCPPACQRPGQDRPRAGSLSASPVVRFQRCRTNTASAAGRIEP